MIFYKTMIENSTSKIIFHNDVSDAICSNLLSATTKLQLHLISWQLKSFKLCHAFAMAKFVFVF